MSNRILVLNCFVKGWNILKALADDDFVVNAGHHTPDAPGLFSNRVADKSANLIYPDPTYNQDDFVEAVIDHLTQHKFDIVLPVNAAEMMALAKHKEQISKLTNFPFENYSKLMLLHDKKYFHELIAGEMGESFLPQSFSIGDTTEPIEFLIERAGLTDKPVFAKMENFSTADDFLASQPDLKFPTMVKTRRATSSVGVYRVHDSKQLQEACRALGGADIIVQECIAGRGTGISSLRWDNPDLLQHFGHKRVREYPISGGASTSREPWNIENHHLTGRLSNLLNKLKWHSVVMFEFKEIEPEKRYLFLEANPRFWGSVPLAIANGVNFPALLCRAALGMEIKAVTNANRIRARIIFSDSLSLVLNLLSGRRIWYNLTDYFNFSNLYLDDIDFSDWPGTVKIFKRMIIEFFRRVVGNKR